MLVRGKHFEIYSESDSQTARAALLWFEQLHTFFEQSGFRFDDRESVRVIEFRSPKQYERFCPRATPDAYYAGTGKRHYIVMRSLSAAEFPIAAHEYAHFVLHANGLKLPLWLDEGIAEFFSSVRISSRDSFAGAERPERLAVLKHGSWLPIEELLAADSHASIQSSRRIAPLFYAQSWALVQMLMLSPEYSSRFTEFLTRLAAGQPSSQVLAGIYGKSLGAIERDLHSWVETRRSAPLRLPGVQNAGIAITTGMLSESQCDLLLADLSMASGELDRAQGLYEILARQTPKNPEIWAALGAIALRKHDTDLARQDWRRAIENGIQDAKLCFQYASLADDAGLRAEEIRPALERAIALDSGFDDARYKLALLESNTGHFEEALTRLHAMRTVAAARAFAYWNAVSYASEELGHRKEAEQAATKALQYASTPAEREQARRLAYVAGTDLNVRFTRDAEGRQQLVTTRVPHGAAGWNPFVEPGDRIERAEGRLYAVNCSGGKAIAVVIETSQSRLQLAIADATQIQMRNAPDEFACGLQTAKLAVVVDYAASVAGGDALRADPGSPNAGFLRGMEFR